MAFQAVLAGGSILDVATGESTRRDLFIADGEVIDSGGPDAEVVDVSGLTIMFGLWDCHAHPGTLMHDPAGATFFEGPVRRAIRAGEDMLRAARMGVTGIRCLGEPHDIDLAWSAAFGAGAPAGPRVIGAARAIATTGGHGTTWPRRHADTPREGLSGWTIAVDGPVAMARTVRAKAERGVHWIKLMLTGGLFSAHESVDGVQFTDEEFRAVMAAAAERRLPVAAHCGSPEAAVRFAKAGGRSLEHGYMLDEEAIEAMASAGTWLVPTIGVTHDIDFQYEQGFPSYAIQRAEEAAPRHRDALVACLEAGVPIATGADGVPTGPLLHAELGMLETAGMTRLQVLRAATAGGRSLVGLGDHTSPTPGVAADLIMLEGDPLESLDVLSHPAGVMAHGRFVVHPSGR